MFPYLTKKFFYYIWSMIDNITFFYQNQPYEASLSQGFDLSIPLQNGTHNPNCYWAEPPQFETIRMGDFVGSVALGGSVNYQKIHLTPHGNGTHTECYGHISADPEATLARCLKPHQWLMAKLVSLEPQKTPEGDDCIFVEQLQPHLEQEDYLPEAIIIRTLPNGEEKKTKQYTNTNPPYFSEEFGKYLASKNISHFLVDLPSVDKEIDGGKLAVHRGFWNTETQARKEATITEMIFVPEKIKDGWYLLTIQTIQLESDASPSRPIIYTVRKK